MVNVLKRRFEEVLKEADSVEGTVRPSSDGYGRTFVDKDRLLSWTVKAENIVERACGRDSVHVRHFISACKLGSMQTTHSSFLERRAVFVAAKDDFEGGYLVSLHNLVTAEVFESELEQASELLKNSFATAAAVIAGTVLETTIRDLCSRHGIQHGALDKMNIELVKAGAYNALTQKRITALAAIRNSAAHGRPGEFTRDDVKAMIEEVERFLSQHLT